MGAILLLMIFSLLAIFTIDIHQKRREYLHAGGLDNKSTPLRSD